MKSRNKNLLIVAHDAGGANILAAWVVKNFKKYNFLFCLENPALKIFQDKKIVFKNIKYKNLNFVWDKIDFILTGTSYPADLERLLIAQAKKKKIKSASFIDHWVNYRKRFLPLGHEGKVQNFLPDEIWVGDRFALKMALEEGFTRNKLKLIPNPYFQEVRKIKQNIQNSGKIAQRKKILFLSSIFSENNFNEFDFLEEFLKILKSSGKKIEITIKLHPSEKIGKYNKLIKKYPELKINQSKSQNLVQEINKADLVIGQETMALVVAMLLSKTALNYKPNGLSAIPFRKIKIITSLSKIEKYL
ncbi:MAG: hypothetical protein WCV69_02460 [Patescibacteria group bacterium]|jgi:hypothetical protein